MLRTVRFRRSISNESHCYLLVDSNFTVEESIVTIADSGRYVNTLYDEVAVITKEYTARNLTVAPNIALHIYKKYCEGQDRRDAIARYSSVIDDICSRTVRYYPYADINKYKPCLLRQLDKLLWSTKNSIY